MRVLIGIPTFDRRIDIELVKLLVNLENIPKYSFEYLFPVSSHLCRNRNYICQTALEQNHDAVLFLDSDIGIEDSSFVDKLIETGFKFNAKIIGGAYRMKKADLTDTTYIAGTYQNSKLENFKQIKEPQLVDGLGTGCMLIYREVLEKMKDPWFTIIDKPKLEVMPEDFEFCRKAQELGFNIAIDPRFNTNHYGQHAWRH